MAGQIERFNVTVLSGTTSAEIVPAVATGQTRVGLHLALGYAVQCTIYAPAVLAEVAAVQVSPTDPGVTWYTISGVVPTAANVITFVPPAAEAMRILLAGNAASDRTFIVEFQYDMAT